MIFGNGCRYSLLDTVLMISPLRGVEGKANKAMGQAVVFFKALLPVAVISSGDTTLLQFFQFSGSFSVFL